MKAFLKTAGFFISKRRFFQSDGFFKAMVSKRRFFQSDGFSFKATVFFFKAMVFKATVFSKRWFSKRRFFQSDRFSNHGLSLRTVFKFQIIS
jgi:hypothetical protein